THGVPHLHRPCPVPLRELPTSEIGRNLSNQFAERLSIVQLIRIALLELDDDFADGHPLREEPRSEISSANGVVNALVELANLPRDRRNLVGQQTSKIEQRFYLEAHRARGMPSFLANQSHDARAIVAEKVVEKQKVFRPATARTIRDSRKELQKPETCQPIQ